MKSIYFILISMVLFSANVNADLYKWVDSKGVAHYSNKRPPSSANEIEVKGEYRTNAPVEREDHELDNLINSYKKDTLNNKEGYRKDQINPNSTAFDPAWVNYLKKRIRNKEDEYRRYDDDLIRFKRTPYKDFRSHKERLRYYEDRLDRTRRALQEAENDYQEYINGK